MSHEPTTPLNTFNAEPEEVRPPAMETLRLRVPRDLLEQADELVTFMAPTRSHVMRALLYYGLEHHKKIPVLKKPKPNGAG